MTDAEIEEERLRALQELNAAQINGTDLVARFGPGTFGAHELLDRAYVASDTWSAHLQNHAAAVLDPELYRAATEITEKIGKFYGLVAQRTEIDNQENR